MTLGFCQPCGAGGAAYAFCSALDHHAVATRHAGSRTRRQGTTCTARRGTTSVLEHVGRTAAVNDGLLTLIDGTLSNLVFTSQNGNGASLGAELLANPIAVVPKPFGRQVVDAKDSVISGVPFYLDPVLVADNRVRGPHGAASIDAAVAHRGARRNRV